MNTGIADAVDLGWKLAATLNGWAGDGLLSAYGGERLPIGTRNVNVAAEFIGRGKARQRNRQRSGGHRKAAGAQATAGR